MSGSERMVTIATTDGVLEGVFVGTSSTPDRGALIAPPDPLLGGSMDSPVLNQLAHACHECGLVSLRFNWQGVGASSGKASRDAGAAASDYGAALEHLEATVPGELTACGYSFGAVTALRVGAQSSRVGSLILVAPPTSLLDANALGAFRGSVLVLAGGRDPWAPPGELGAWVKAHPAARMEVVPEADHFFASGLSDLGNLAKTWLRDFALDTPPRN